MGAMGGVDSGGGVGPGGEVPVEPGAGTLNDWVSPLPNCPSLEATKTSPFDVSA